MDRAARAHRSGLDTGPRPPPALRDPAGLAFAPAGIPAVLAAVHHGADALARVAVSDREAVRAAAASRRLFVPTRLLPSGHDVPYPYSPAPAPHADALLATYDSVITSAIRAARILDDLAVTVDAPSSLLGAIRAANRQPMPRLPRRDNRPALAQPPAIHPEPGQVERALRKLNITEPALLARAAVIDDAARDLITEATAKSHRRGVAGPARQDISGNASDLRRAVLLAAHGGGIVPHRPMILWVLSLSGIRSIR